MNSSLHPGMTGSVTRTVPIERTAPHLLPECPEFTALPQAPATDYLVGAVEWICIRALQGHLDDGETTLGVHVDLPHQARTTAGRTFTVTAELTVVEDRQLVASEARDDVAMIVRGTCRAVIDRQHFSARQRTRASSPDAHE